MSGVVRFLPPLQAEKQAYALARYSRSADPVEDSLAWVETHSEERFWESFYFDYGHASIADLGHVAVCFENISELAALEVLDEQTWDGQARSTRYQDFATAGHVTPPELAGHALEADYHDGVERLVRAYRDVHAQAEAWLRSRHPCPADMSPKQYDRNVAARAFDSARYLLPLGIPTSVGQVTSIRTLEKQISRLLVSDLAEVRELGEALIEGCRSEPLGGGKPPAPTLARHASPSSFTRSWRDRARAITADRFADARPAAAGSVRLCDASAPEIEFVTGLLYESARLPWEELARRVGDLPAAERETLVKDILADRTRHDELPRPARAGHRYIFEIVMDVGGWRDMHRHRRCQQHLQGFDLDAGAEMPDGAGAIGIEERCRSEHERAVHVARRLHDALGPRVAAYALPFMHRVRSVFKMDFAEADYIARLRSGVKGHPSYRRVAWGLYEELRRAEPSLAFLLHATPPEIEDPLTR